MRHLDPAWASQLLRTAALELVIRFRSLAKERMDGLDLAGLGVPDDHKFIPYASITGTATPDGNHGMLFEWLNDIELPSPGDPVNVKNAKLADIDKLGRLIAVADIRLVVETPQQTVSIADAIEHKKKVALRAAEKVEEREKVKVARAEAKVEAKSGGKTAAGEKTAADPSLSSSTPPDPAAPKAAAHAVAPSAAK